MPVVQIDWEKIKTLLSPDTHLYVLTQRQAGFLLSLAEQLTWRKTWRAFDYDFADWDSLEAEIADTQRNLMMGVDLAELLGYIDDIESMLQVIIDRTSSPAANDPCCESDVSEGSLYTDPVVDGVGNVPQNIIDAGYASGSSDWDGFDDYKCMISHIAVDDIESKLRQFAGIFDDIGIIAGGVVAVIGIITAIFSAGITVLLAGILAAAGTAAYLYDQLTDAEFATDLADKVSLNHEELVCAMYSGDGTDDSVDQLYAKIDELFTGPEAVVLKLLNTRAAVRGMYGGRYKQMDVADILLQAGYDLDDFTCETCDYTPATPVVNTIDGSAPVWNPTEGYWEMSAEFEGGCWRVWQEFWEDFVGGTRVKIRQHVLSCDQSNTCGGSDHHRGHDKNNGGWDEIWAVDHPVLPTPGLGATHRNFYVHNSKFDLTYRLYEE